AHDLRRLQDDRRSIAKAIAPYPKLSESMSLTLHFHPLASFCHKALIALYENDTPFERRIVNLMDPSEAAAFKKLWPCGKFPVLQDGNRTIPESSIIIEHLDLQHPGKTRFIPADPKLALQVRLKDRFYDLHVHDHMQKIVGDKLRPEGKKDPHGVENARAPHGLARHDRCRNGRQDLGHG